MDIESEDDGDIDEEGYSSFSELDSESDDEPRLPVSRVLPTKDVFQEETAFDDEDNVEDELNRLNRRKRSNIVTREYPNLLKLSPDAKDPIDLNWQKRPTRTPYQLWKKQESGSRFISFTPNTPPEEMFFKFWNEPSDVVLKGMNERSAEIFAKKPRKQQPEQYSKDDLLAFAAAWLLMDCTPLRQRRQFWRKYK